MKKLRRNWWLPMSAAAYFCLQATASVPYLLGIPVAAGLLAWLVSRMGSIWQWIKAQKAGWIVLSMLSTAGICWAGLERFRSNWKGSENLGFLLALAAFGAVFVFTLWFWHWLGEFLRESGVFQNLGRGERLLYALLLLAAAAGAALLFTRTDACYGTPYEFDIVYTSDSPVLVKENAYLNLNHKENDLRQPLFAVFTAPLLGGAYFVGTLLGNPGVQAALMNGVLLGMLFGAHLLLAQAMELPPEKRICFLLLTLCSYTQLLFSWMMEQYIPAYFFLMQCICQCCRKGKPDRPVLWAAGGTLLTSLILLPNFSPLGNWKQRVRKLMLVGMEFLGILLVFCRLDVLATAAHRVLFLSSFAGLKVSVWERICQFSVFLSGCFLAPEAGASSVIPEHTSWQLAPAEGLNWGGVLIFLLCAVSAWWNWDKKSSRLAAAWCAFSVVMLLVLGWGTKENGLILYSLYFGWAYAVLLFQLVQKAGERIGKNWFLPAVSALCAAVMLARNLPAMGELIRFLISHFPT